MTDSIQAVSCSAEAGIATIRMAARHGNAINEDLLGAIGRCLREVEADPDVRGVLLTSGGKIFCPGLDLPELLAYDRPAMERFMAMFSDCMLSLYGMRKPLIAGISGHAVAGGCVLALTADRRILRGGSMIGLNEVQVGVPLPFGVAIMLRDSVSGRRLEEIALVGKNYSDEEAVRCGLVHEVHGADGFESRCLQVLREYASKDPAALATTKGYLRSPVVERIREHDARHRGEFLDCWFSAETRRRIERIAADLGRRSP